MFDFHELKGDMFLCTFLYTYVQKYNEMSRFHYQVLIVKYPVSGYHTF